jgi:hypothetical protein
MEGKALAGGQFALLAIKSNNAFNTVEGESLTIIKHFGGKIIGT